MSTKRGEEWGAFFYLRQTQKKAKLLMQAPSTDPHVMPAPDESTKYPAANNRSNKKCSYFTVGKINGMGGRFE